MSSFTENFYNELNRHEERERRLAHLKETMRPELMTLDPRTAGPDPLWFAGVCQPIEDLEGHFLTLGKTGSGKSLTTKITLRSYLMSLKPGRNRRAIIFDTKGDTLQLLQGMKQAGELNVPIQYLSINDQRAGIWNIAQDICRYDKARDVINLLAPAQNSNDPFWQNCGKSIMTYCAKGMIKRKGTTWKFHDLYNASLSSIEDLQEILQWFERGKDIVNLLLHKDMSKTAAGIRAQLFTQIEPLESLAAQSQLVNRPGISLEAVLTTDQVLVIGQDFSARESSQPYIQALFQRLVELISASPDGSNGHTLFVLDECRFLGKFPKLLELITFSRSKGAHCIITAQGVGGLQELYGRNVAEEIFENCDYKSLFNLGSRPSAEWAANLIGRVPVVDIASVSGDGMNATVNRRFDKRDAVTYDNFLSLPLPNKNRGLFGYFRSDQLTPNFFRQFFPAEMIDHLLPPVDTTVPAQVPWPDDVFYVRPWTTQERHEFFKGVYEDAERSKQMHASADAFTRAVNEEVFDLVADIHRNAVQTARRHFDP